ncbi:MAG TPA: prolipoprotein diacylglyceryl transferase, partial [Synergistaceae bacterium]|nr:prolipoprotein diacylglyceryl transferase [Synergistaceae bacterium]
MPVHSYYILWTFSLMLAVFWTKRRLMGPFALDEDRAVTILLWGLVGLYVGARLGAVYDHWDYFSAHPWRIVSPWEGGLSAITAFAGAGIGAAWRCHRLKVPLGTVAEAASLPAAVTETLGRWG